MKTEYRIGDDCPLKISHIPSQTCDGNNSIREDDQGSPSPVGMRYIALTDEWRKQNPDKPSIPNVILDEAWDIAFHPTETKELLSRTKKPLGITHQVARKPSFLK